MIDEYVKNQKGFTLVESLIVLSVVSVMVSMPIISFQSVQKEIETSLFLEELQSTITLFQNHAILLEETTTFETRPTARDITFKVAGVRNHDMNRSLKLPAHIELISSSRVYRFVAGSGNLGNINAIRLKADDQLFVIKFSLGSGRFEVAKVD